MRVLMVTDFYPPVIGGLERYVQLLARELARCGHQVAVATQWREGSPAYEVDGAGVRVHRVAGWNRALKPFYESPERPFLPTAPDPGITAGLRRVVAHERPDVVHAHGWMLYSYLPLKNWSKAALVVTLHDYGLVCSKKSYMRHGRVCDGAAYARCISCAAEQYGAAKSLALTSGLYLSKLLHGRVDRYIAVSNAVAQANRPGMGAVPPPVEIIPSFVDADALDEDPQQDRPAFLPQGDGYILYVGALGGFKGLHILLEAYKGIEELAPLVLIGPRRSDTPAALPPGVTIVPGAPHAEVMAAWRHCSIGVVPSVWPEPQPLVTIEAMASGHPVVVSNIGGLPDQVVDGETGLVVPPGNVEALRDALRTLLNDSRTRERMGAAARARARYYTVTAIVPHIMRVYDDAIAS